jgi:hypothetical protein
VNSVPNRQWNNHISGLRDEAFPELGPPLVADESEQRGPDMSRPWNCLRCTYLNTRIFSTNCDICGLDRPPQPDVTDQVVTTPAESASGTNARPKRIKQKIVLSSATQRDYKR